jgi:hypothetical protein
MAGRLNKVPRRNDHKRGLVFDWRDREMFTWRVLWVMLLPAAVACFLFHFVNVRVSDPNLKRTHEHGSVVMLNRELTIKAMSGHHTLPMAVKPPVWASSPLGMESNDENLIELGGGLDEYEPRLIPQPATRPMGVRDTLLSNLNYPRPDVDRWIVDAPKTRLMEPAISAASHEMDGWYMDHPLSTEMTGFDGMRTRVWVVVTMLGVPDQVVVYDSSNDPEVDERAVEYIKNLRWLPNGKRRTGSMTVEWKEGQS